MFTGLYSLQHTLYDMEFVLPAALPTLAERLSQAGYHTVSFSNNHMIGRLNNGLGRGFKTLTNYGQTRKVVQTAGSRSATPRDRILQALVQSPTIKNILLLPQIKPLAMAFLWDIRDRKGNTARSLNDAMRFMIDRPGLSPGQPLFTFINLMGVHAPYYPPDWAVKQFAPQLSNGNTRKLLKNFNTELSEMPRLLAGQLGSEWKATLDGLYNAEIATQDALLGKFFDQLRSAGVLDNTLFIIVSDHGECLGEKQLLSHSFGAYRELIHVPLLVRDPLGDLPRGTIQDTCVSTRRVFHTALASAGIATPEEEALTLARVGAQDAKTLPVFAESLPAQEAQHKIERKCPGLLKARGYDQIHLAVYIAGHKLIMTGDSCVGLYDIYDDPTESQDLQQMMPDKVEALRQSLRDFEQQSGSVTPEVGAKIDDVALLERLRALGYIDS
jgi:arylsulfatase A-like enzyme